MSIPPGRLQLPSCWLKLHSLLYFVMGQLLYAPQRVVREPCWYISCCITLLMLHWQRVLHLVFPAADETSDFFPHFFFFYRFGQKGWFPLLFFCQKCILQSISWDLIDDFQAFVFIIPLALLCFLLCSAFSISSVQPSNILRNTQV